MQPYVMLHMGISVDGRIDYGTGAEGLYYSLVEGFNADADLSGSNTMLAAQLSADPQRDFPELYSIWASKPRCPALAVVDSRGRLKNWNLVLNQPFWSDFISICSCSTPQEHLNYLHDLGVKTIIAGENQVDLRCALEELNERFAVKVIRVDSGGIL